MEFFDTHSHYNDEKFNEDREQIIKDTYKSGVTKFVCAGYNIESSKKAIEMSQNMNLFILFVGFHLMIFHDQRRNCGKNIAQITKIIEDNKTNKLVAIGEIGLDYYWNKKIKSYKKKHL